MENAKKLMAEDSTIIALDMFDELLDEHHIDQRKDFKSSGGSNNANNKHGSTNYLVRTGTSL